MIELELAKLENEVAEFNYLVYVDKVNGTKFAEDLRRDMEDKIARSFIVYKLDK